jgi:hypothetical protein
VPTPDAPGEFPAAFVDAVARAVKRPDAPEVDVAVAIGLGWYLAALSHPGDVVQSAAAARGDLAGLAALEEGQVLDYCESQVEVAFVRLEALVKKAGLKLPSLDKLKECLKDATRREEAGHVENRVSAVLGAVDFKLGKAYGVGRALLNLTSRPAPGATLASHLTEARVAPVVAAIDDLSSVLAPHAGHSVRDSIHEWRISVTAQSTVVPEAQATWHQLARQGELWRALLAGEKSGLDMLEIDDYVDAADRLSRRMRAVFWRVVKRFPVVIAIVLLLFAIGIAVVIAFRDSAAAIVAGAGTILASLGLTWRGAGGALGGLAGKLEQPLWGAELDVAIKEAITLLEREDVNKHRDAARARRELAIAMGRPAQPPADAAPPAAPADAAP